MNYVQIKTDGGYVLVAPGLNGAVQLDVRSDSGNTIKGETCTYTDLTREQAEAVRDALIDFLGD